MNSGDTLHCSLCRTVECLQTKENEKNKGKGKSSAKMMAEGWSKRRRSVTLHYLHATWTVKSVSKRRIKRMGRGRAAQQWWTEGRWKRRRSVVKESCSPLIDGGTSFLYFCSSPLFLGVPLSTVCNTAWIWFLLTCGLNVNSNGSHR